LYKIICLYLTYQRVLMHRGFLKMDKIFTLNEYLYMLINFNEYINCCFSIFSTIRLLAIRVINSNYQYNIAPRPVVQSSISLHVSIPVYLRCSSTTSNHLFLGLPCGLFPSGFHFITDLTVLLSLLLITYPSHRSLCHLIKIVTGVTSTA